VIFFQEAAGSGRLLRKGRHLAKVKVHNSFRRGGGGEKEDAQKNEVSDLGYPSKKKKKGQQEKIWDKICGRGRGGGDKFLFRQNKGGQKSKKEGVAWRVMLIDW